MSFIGKRVVGGIADRGLESLTPQIAVGIHRAIDLAVGRRGAAAALKADLFRVDRQDLAGAALDRALIRKASRETGVFSVVTALPSILPVVGTAVEIATATGDETAVAYREVMLILQLLHLHGRDLGDTDARRLDVLLVLGLDTGVVKRDGQKLKIDKVEVVIADLNNDLPDPVYAALARRIGVRVARHAARRRSLFIGKKLIPFGIGVVMAGSNGLRSVAGVGKATTQYLALIEGDPAAQRR